MWFWFSIIALLCWSGSDLFSKIGCREANDKTAHLKMVMAVGIVMGLHACFEIFVNGVEINMQIIMTYLPVSLLYIISMAMGYIGLRYIELSISSPICNSSGALVAIATIAMSGIGDMNAWQLTAIALVAVGVVALGVTEATEDSANVAYELTFLVAGLVCGAYVLFVKREKLTPRTEAPKYIGAVCETIGQFFYIYALADSAHVAMSAPIISSYCAASVLWSRIFLKEKLSAKHYISILMVFIGIVIMGVFDM